jgi:hypothetical protein
VEWEQAAIEFRFEMQSLKVLYTFLLNQSMKRIRMATKRIWSHAGIDLSSFPNPSLNAIRTGPHYNSVALEKNP